MPVRGYDENGVEIVSSWSPDDNNLLDGLLMSMRDLGMGRGDYDKNDVESYLPVIRDPDDDYWQADDKHWGFGVEIEMVVKPRTIYDFSSNEFLNDSITYWSHKLVKLLEGKGLSAVAAPPEDYDKWFITQDASLEHRKYEVALEAVSPRNYDDSNYDRQIDIFWEAIEALFEVQKNTSCGSHFHVAPWGRSYTLMELKAIAWAVASQENLVLKILPQERIDNEYCRPNSVRSEDLSLDIFHGSDGPANEALDFVARRIMKFKSGEELCQYMQAGQRRVLWNFSNTVGEGKSRTIEFRGGRHLRGRVRTKRWIAFAVSFITLAIDNKDNVFVFSYETEIDIWWRKIRHQASQLRMSIYLPVNWSTMKDASSSF